MQHAIVDLEKRKVVLRCTMERAMDVHEIVEKTTWRFGLLREPSPRPWL